MTDPEQNTDPEQKEETIEEAGDPRVDAAVRRLAELRTLGTAEHPEVYEDIHRRLQGALADLDGS
ncbi:MAG: hypothetical protein GEV03_27465 [Streptosporangiales bacterium]|nr:hypothetical protein [Streptosporangiales bacterium]